MLKKINIGYNNVKGINFSEEQQTFRYIPYIKFLIIYLRTNYFGN